MGSSRGRNRATPDNNGLDVAGREFGARNLIFSIFAEHIGFSVWTLFAVMVRFMDGTYGMIPADKFLMVATATCPRSSSRATTCSPGQTAGTRAGRR
jgi:nitrate/nitrite transporter NarK